MKTSALSFPRSRLHPPFVSLLIACLVGVAYLDAMPADPRPFEFTQPDGSTVMLYLRGDEFYHWQEDANGFTVVRNENTYVYAALNARGELEPTAWVAGQVNPSTMGLTPSLMPRIDLRALNSNTGQSPYRPWAAKNAAALHTEAARPGDITTAIVASGTVKNLVILCLFSDHTIAANGRPQSDYNVLFNNAGVDAVLAPTGSVRAAFTENSYGTVTLQSTIVAWVTLPQTMAYYAGTNNGQKPVTPPPAPANPSGYPNNSQKMVEDALALADPLVDFAQFDTDNDGYVDAIDFIHSGYGAETNGAPANSIWSVKWNLPADWTSAENNANGVKVKVNDFHTEPALWGTSGTAITRIGVICHETGHFFGLPDLYDSATPRTSRGIGSWCMMANSWGFDQTQLRPPHFSAWCKVFLGWVVPTGLIDSGTYSVTQAETTKSIFYINLGLSEHLLVENRQPVGLDSDIPQGGLAIWHIDERVSDNTNEGFPGQVGWPENGNHYKVALLQADGRYDLEKNNGTGDAGDLYRGTSQNSIGMSTVPSTDKYLFGSSGPTAIRITAISNAGATMTFNFSRPFGILYVDKFYSGPDAPNGAAHRPFRRIVDAYNAAEQDDTIVIRAADYAEAPLNNLSKRVTFESRLGDGVVK